MQHVPVLVLQSFKKDNQDPAVQCGLEAAQAQSTNRLLGGLRFDSQPVLKALVGLHAPLVILPHHGRQ
jgi:hypothetical protein